MFDIEYYVNPDLKLMVDVYEKIKKSEEASMSKDEEPVKSDDNNKKSFNQSLNEYEKNRKIGE